MLKPRTVFLTLMLMVSQPLFGDYYLKFSTSGSALPDNTALNASADAWLKVSIVDTFPLDGPVQYKGSQTEAFPKHHKSSYEKIVGANDLNYYYADVPRSITLVNKSNGAKTVVSFGDPQPVTLTGAPAVLLPDETLVAPGVSNVFSTYAIYMAAARPYRSVTDTIGVDPTSPDLTNHMGATSCLQGWSPGFVHMNSVQIISCINQAAPYDGKAGRIVFSGFITHVVQLR